MQILTKKIWLTLGVSTLLIRAILSAETIEQIYSRGFFLHIRKWTDAFVPQIPFPPFFLFWAFAIIGIFYCFRHFRGIYSFKRKTLMSVLSLANLMGAIIFSFMILWGFNYKRIPVEEQLNLSTESFSLEELKSHLEDQTSIIEQMRKSVFRISDMADNEPITQEQSPIWLEDLMRESLEKVLEKYDYPSDGKVNIRELKPEGI